MISFGHFTGAQTLSGFLDYVFYKETLNYDNLS